MSYFSSARSSEDILAASQVHGDTDTPITSVFQNSVISTGSAKQTWRACLSSAERHLNSIKKRSNQRSFFEPPGDYLLWFLRRGNEDS